MLGEIRRYFNFRELRTGLRTEIIAGMTTFMAMAYIIFLSQVNSLRRLKWE